MRYRFLSNGHNQLEYQSLRDTPLLRPFLAVATEGSISAACARLAVSQPALTKSIQGGEKVRK